ncbi:hypothetical protein K3495_g7250 [Podosphaera aphanis]|nr:hypothetical protein K3495_g7250 [Podosphaera aphanis]
MADNNPSGSSGSSSGTLKMIHPSAATTLESMDMSQAAINQLDPVAWTFTAEQTKTSQSVKQRATFVLSQISMYIGVDIYDEQLLWQFLEDFEGWTQADLTNVTRSHSFVATAIKKHFPERGIFLGRNYNQALANLIKTDEDRVPDWPEDALKEQSQLHPNLLQSMARK